MSAAATSTSTRITRDDLEAKFRSVQGEVEEQKASAISTAVTVGAVVVVGVIAVAFLFGRRKGKKRTTIVEVRRI
jgi:heme/copper-type cytochrome/quinol oxidase subunit 2